MDGGASTTMARAIPYDAAKPATPPAAASTSVSMSHSRAICIRVAPSATRTASSRRRRETRVSMRPDTLVHPITSSAITAASSAHSA